jgi:ArsR family transcriptional regulator
VNISIAYVFVKTYTLRVARKANFDMQQFFQALGDNTRLRLLNLMGEQKVCVCYFVEILGGPQPKISRHLAYLRNAGIVSVRREGKWMHYRITMPQHIGATQILRQTIEWLKKTRQCRQTWRVCGRLAAPRRSTLLMALRCPRLCLSSAVRPVDGRDIVRMRGVASVFK